jgi:glutamate N-acetyltransferase/amino-acid N-acetyltransferase
VNDTQAPALRLAPIAGVRLGVAAAGLKSAGRDDLMVMEICSQAAVAAVFTRNAFCAAPVVLARRHMAQHTPRYLLVNAGNANAGTGERGLQDAAACCQSLANATAVSMAEVLPFSTGVIGEPLPVASIVDALPAALASLSADGWERAAGSIMTTDTRPKGFSRRLALSGGEVTITGIAKGAGMIKPNMATMLSYVATDAVLAREPMQALFGAAVEGSFNRITIDGDTSTNDACVLVATGRSGVALAPETADWQLFADALAGLLLQLAQSIVKDGEGATKFVAVQVSGGISSGECLSAAYAVAESPLVKTALFASDANWGRILAAVGRAGIVDLDVTAVRIALNDVLIAEQGARAESYREEQGSAAMAADTITIDIDLGRGDCCETVWTTDLSYDYIRINAEYRT